MSRYYELIRRRNGGCRVFATWSADNGAGAGVFSFSGAATRTRKSFFLDLRFFCFFGFYLENEFTIWKSDLPNILVKVSAVMILTAARTSVVVSERGLSLFL